MELSVNPGNTEPSSLFRIINTCLFAYSNSSEFAGKVIGGGLIRISAAGLQFDGFAFNW